MSMERETIQAAIKQAGDDGSFEAVVATFGVVDHDGDIIEHGAFGDQTMSIMPAHDSMHVPLGKATIEERGELAVAVGQFNMDIQPARDWSSALKFDLAHPPAVQEWSWGFKVLKDAADTVDGQSIRRLIELDMRELSPVLRGASIGTETLSAKGMTATARHTSDTSAEPWTAADEQPPGAFALNDDRGAKTTSFLPHHFLDDDGAVAAASVRACAAGIALVKGDAGAWLDEGTRLGIYLHLAGHLADAGVDVSPFDDRGLKLIDQVQLVAWDVEAAVARVMAASAARAERGRGLGDDTKAVAMGLAAQVGELDRVLGHLRSMVDELLPKAEAARAAAKFLATDALRLGVDV